MTGIDFATYGIVPGGQVMDNGERRFRLVCRNDGTAYIRTEAGEGSGWQNAHYHLGVKETYIVQSGTVIFAEEKNGTRMAQVYRAGDVFTTEVWVAHNMYMCDGAVTHTVKHGVAVGNPKKGGADWYPASDDFDQWTKSLKEEDFKITT